MDKPCGRVSFSVRAFSRAGICADVVDNANIA
jgi:hypothetical protein